MFVVVNFKYAFLIFFKIVNVLFSNFRRPRLVNRLRPEPEPEEHPWRRRRLFRVPRQVQPAVLQHHLEAKCKSQFYHYFIYIWEMRAKDCDPWNWVTFWDTISTISETSEICLGPMGHQQKLAKAQTSTIFPGKYFLISGTTLRHQQHLQIYVINNKFFLGIWPKHCLLLI